MGLKWGNMNGVVAGLWGLERLSEGEMGERR